MAVPLRKLSGLNLEVNPHGDVEGSLSEATNVVIRRRGVVEPRPGLKQSSEYTTVELPQNVRNYDGELILFEKRIIFDSRVFTLQGGSETEIQDQGSGPLLPWDGYCRSAEARKNLYIGTERGIQKITSGTDTTADWAGVVPAGWLELSTATPSAGYNWLANNNYVGYRAIVRREDANGVIVRSRPTPLHHLQNTSGSTTHVDVRVHINDWIRAGDVIELFRTLASSVAVPADTFLVVEQEVTAADVTNRYLDIGAGVPDATSDALQEEDLGRRPPETKTDPPYAAKCVAEYAGSVFAGNTLSPQYLHIENVKKDAGGGFYRQVLAAGSTTTGSAVFTWTGPIPADVVPGMKVFCTSFPVGPTQVLSVNYGAGTVTMNQNATATSGSVTASFADVLEITDGTTTEHIYVGDMWIGVAGNYTPGLDFLATPSTLVYAVLLNDKRVKETHGNSVQGIRLIEAIPGGPTLQARVTNAQDFPGLSEYDDGLQDFSQDIEPALLQWSQVDQPESFTPGIGQVFVGNTDKAILALIADTDRLYVFKEDGVFILQGPSERAGFRLEQISQVHILISPRHVCNTPQGVCAFTDQGVVVVRSGGGIDNLSAQKVRTRFEYYRPNTEITELAGNMFYAERELHVIGSASNAAGLVVNFHLVYNMETEQWTEWTTRTGTVLCGCAPGENELGAGFATATLALMTFDGSGDTFAWQRFPVDGLSADATAEWAASDIPAGTTAFTETLSQDSTGYYMDHVFAAAIVPVAGDMVIAETSSWKAVISSVTDLGGSNYRMRLHTEDAPSTGSHDVQMLYAFQTTVRLRRQASGDPLKWKHWLASHWQLNGPLSLWKATVGIRSSEDGADGTVDQQADTYGTYSATPNQDEWSPRMLITREHAHSHLVSPSLSVFEAGANWRLVAVALKESTGSKEYRRYG